MQMDLLKWHQVSCPAECLSMTPTEAAAKSWVYEAFKKLEKCLKNDESYPVCCFFALMSLHIH